MKSTAYDYRGRKGMGILAVVAEYPEKIKVQADEYAFYDRSMRRVVSSGKDMDRFAQKQLRNRRTRRMARKTGITFVKHHNAYVNTGLNNSLDREFGLGGTAIGYIGVSSSTSAVTAATVNLNGASGGTAANTIIKAISPVASRTAQTTTAGATFVNADFTSGVFVMNKIGLLTTATDAGTGLVDVIGGTGGSSPYNRTFSLDLTAAGSFSATMQIAVTAVAV